MHSPWSQNFMMPIGLETSHPETPLACRLRVPVTSTTQSTDPCRDSTILDEAVLGLNGRFETQLSPYEAMSGELADVPTSANVCR